MEDWEKQVQTALGKKASTEEPAEDWEKSVQAALKTPVQRPTTTGRRGGTRRELMGAYGAGQMAPGLQTPNIGPEVVPTALAGLGKGLTAGLTVYPAAGALYATRLGEGGYKTALADVRRYEQQIAEQAPLASGLGQIAGTALGVGKAATPLRAIGMSAGYGGTSEFTRSAETGIPEVVGGTVIGAAIPAAAQGVGKLADKAKDTIIKRGYTENLNNLIKTKRDAITENEQKLTPALARVANELPQDKLEKYSTDTLLKFIQKGSVGNAKFTKQDRELAETVLKDKNYVAGRERSIEAVKDLSGEALRKRVKSGLSTAEEQIRKQEYGTPQRVMKTLGAAAKAGVGGAVGFPILSDEYSALGGAGLGLLLGGGFTGSQQAAAALYQGTPKQKVLLGLTKMPEVAGPLLRSLSAGTAPLVSPYSVVRQEPVIEPQMMPTPEPTPQRNVMNTPADIDSIIERFRRGIGEQ